MSTKKSMAFESVFGQAPEVVTGAKKTKSGRSEIDLVGLDKVAAMNILVNALEEEAKGELERIKEEITAIFVKQAMASGKRPDSFVGRGKVSSASCELRKKASTSPLSDEMVKILQSNGLEACIDKKVKSSQMYVINQDLPQEVLERLAEVVTRDPDLKNHKIVLNRPEEYSYIVSDSALDLLAKHNDESFAFEVINKISTISCGKFKISGDDEGSKSITPYAKQKSLEILIESGVILAPESKVSLPKSKSKRLSEGDVQ